MQFPSSSLQRNFFEREADIVAQDLLGKLLVHNVLNAEGVISRVGRIVETEAYLGPEDKAAHSSKGQTLRNQVLFGPAGHAYIYLIYGIYELFNVSTGPAGSGVLVRAVEPVANISAKTSGPGLLTKALEITREHNGLDLTYPENILTIADSDPSPTTQEVTITPRIGVDYAGEWARAPLRFFIAGNTYVSRRN